MNHVVELFAGPMDGVVKDMTSSAPDIMRLVGDIPERLLIYEKVLEFQENGVLTTRYRFAGYRNQAPPRLAQIC